MIISRRFEGCIVAGAIGDAWGSAYENQQKADDRTYFLYGKPEQQVAEWKITDDTQLTLASCQAIIKDIAITPKTFATEYLDLFSRRKIKGIGASTLKAMQELQAGIDWRLTGRKGQYAAGNGAAMRIAPLAFINKIENQKIRDICAITHNNDEAYVGALSIKTAIRTIIDGDFTGDEDLLSIIIDQIPDTLVRDRFIEIRGGKLDLMQTGKLGNDGYVVNSVPLAIVAASQVKKLGLETMFQQLLDIGGDTDTNCSMAGQIAGTLIGKHNIPTGLITKLKRLDDYQEIEQVVRAFINTQFI